MLQFLYHNLQFRVLISLSLLLILLSSKAVIRWCSVKTVFLQILQKFTRKHLYWSFIFNEVSDLQRLNLSKKTPSQVSSCKFCEIPSIQNPFGRLVRHITYSVYCSITTSSLFEDDVTHIFRMNSLSA